MEDEPSINRVLTSNSTMNAALPSLISVLFSPLTILELLFLALLLWSRRLKLLLLILLPLVLGNGLVLFFAAPQGVQKAVWSTPGGGFALHTNAPIPRALLPGFVVVKVNYASLNPMDTKLFQYFATVPFLRLILPHAFAHDVSGTVHESSCPERLKKGDAVFGLTATGAMQEYTLGPCYTFSRVPKGLSMDKAAALPVVAASAWVALGNGVVKKNMTVVVIGSVGGTGSIGVTLAKSLGAQKIACVASGKNKAASLELGCDGFYAYDDKGFEQQILHDLAQQVDVVYDTVSGPQHDEPKYTSLELRLLKPKTGVIRALLPESFAEFFSPRPERQRIFGLATFQVLDELSSNHLSVLQSVLLGKVYNNAFDLNDVRKAADEMNSHRTKGKLVFRVA